MMVTNWDFLSRPLFSPGVREGGSGVFVKASAPETWGAANHSLAASLLSSDLSLMASLCRPSSCIAASVSVFHN